jgi:hypothetical protein
MVEIFLFIIVSGLVAHFIGASVHEGIFVGALVPPAPRAPMRRRTSASYLFVARSAALAKATREPQLSWHGSAAGAALAACCAGCRMRGTRPRACAPGRPAADARGGGGAQVSMSSTSIVIKCLSDTKSTNTPHGAITIGTLILQARARVRQRVRCMCMCRPARRRCLWRHGRCPRGEQSPGCPGRPQPLKV